MTKGAAKVTLPRPFFLRVPTAANYSLNVYCSFIDTLSKLPR